MFFSFYITFWVLLFISAIIFTTLSFLNFKIKKIKYFAYFVSFLSIIFIVSAYGINDFKSIWDQTNNELIDMVLISYVLINLMILIIAIIFIFMVPIRVYINMVIIHERDNIIWKLIKLFLIYGSLAIGVCLLSYIFNDPILDIDHKMTILTFPNSSLANTYIAIQKIIKTIFKSSWICWIFIGYVLTCILASHYLVKNRVFKISNKIVELIEKTKKMSTLFIPFAFLALVTTCIVSWESFILRMLVLICLLTIFLFIMMTQFFIKSKIIKGKKYNLFYKVISSKSQVGSLDLLYDDTVNLISSSIIPIFFMTFLTISNSTLLSSSDIGAHFNLWISIYIGSFLNIFIFNFWVPDKRLSRYFIGFNSAYIINGVNTCILVLFEDLFTLFTKISALTINADNSLNNFKKIRI